MFFKLKKINLVIFLGFLIIVLFLFLDKNSPELFFPNKDFNDGGINFIHGSERAVYWQGSEWVSLKQLPYEGQFQEYPPLAVLFLGLPRFFAENLGNYKTLFSLLAGVCYLALLILTYGQLRLLNKNKNLIWLLLLPSAVYITFNFFDIWPTLLVQASLYFLMIKKNKLSFFLLALAVLAKYYAILFLPIYFILLLPPKNKLKEIFHPLLIFAFTLVIPGIIIYIYAGIDKALFPYLFYFLRTGERGGLFFIIELVLMNRSLFSLTTLYLWIFSWFLCSLFPLLWLFIILWKNKKFKKIIFNNQQLVYFMSLTLILFFIFSKFFSPQWWLWLLPLLILSVETRGEIILVIFSDTLNYIQAPVLWNVFGPSLVVTPFLFLKFALLIWLMIKIFLKMIKKENQVWIS